MTITEATASPLAAVCARAAQRFLQDRRDQLAFTLISNGLPPADVEAVLCLQDERDAPFLRALHRAGLL